MTDAPPSCTAVGFRVVLIDSSDGDILAGPDDELLYIPILDIQEIAEHEPWGDFRLREPITMLVTAHRTRYVVGTVDEVARRIGWILTDGEG